MGNSAMQLDAAIKKGEVLLKNPLLSRCVIGKIACAGVGRLNGTTFKCGKRNGELFNSASPPPANCAFKSTPGKQIK